LEIVKKNEYELNNLEKAGLQTLLKSAFPDCLSSRIYFKQLPHFRLIGSIENTIIGQVGVDHRVISLNGNSKSIFGIIDLCVDSAHKRKGLAEEMILEIESLAKENKIDFIVLFADDQRLYHRLGFQSVSNRCKWLGIDEHKTVGIIQDSLADCMMIKKTGNSEWQNEDVDMLGYLF
jgi:ribosomal protein S18 acetylase RimI-like enzyme